MTKRYTHLSPQAMKEAMGVMDEVFDGSNVVPIRGVKTGSNA